MAEHYTKIKEIFSKNDNLIIRENKSKSFRCPVYLNKDRSEASVEMLELSTRAYNGLRRANINTVGDLCERIKSRHDLKEIRNLGDISTYEIMDHLFAYNYNKLSNERKNEYIEHVIKINAG